jgi:hypothetical protein
VRRYRKWAFNLYHGQSIDILNQYILRLWTMKWLCLAFILFPNINEWKWFRPLDQSFEILLPGIPKYKENIVETEIGEVRQCKYAILWEAAGVPLQFELVQYTYPVGFNWEAEFAHEHHLEFKETWKSQLAAEEMYFQQDENGLSSNNRFSLKYNDSLYIKSQTYWKDRNMFHLQIFCLFKDRLHDDVAKLERNFRF